MGQTGRTLRAGISGSLATILVAVLTGALMAAPAGARTCTKNIAPPGHAGSTQYYETVPTSCGNASPPAGGSNSGSGSPITRLGHGKAGLHALSQQGANGRAAASLAAATAPPSLRSKGRGGSGAAGANGSIRPNIGSSRLDGSAGSGSGALGTALAGSGGGLGILLPILMGAALLAAIAAGVARARRSAGPSV